MDQSTVIYVWTAPAIAKVIGRGQRATRLALSRGAIPGARKCGGRWCLNAETWRSAFEQQSEPRK
jgi:hypothetical protein